MPSRYGVAATGLESFPTFLEMPNTLYCTWCSPEQEAEIGYPVLGVIKCAILAYFLAYNFTVKYFLNYLAILSFKLENLIYEKKLANCDAKFITILVYSFSLPILILSWVLSGMPVPAKIDWPSILAVGLFWCLGDVLVLCVLGLGGKTEIITLVNAGTGIVTILLLKYFIYGEVLLPVQYLGALIIFVGLYLVVMAK